MTEEMIQTEYRVVLTSFSSIFKGNWDKYQEALCHGMIVFRYANLTIGEGERLGLIVDQL